MEESNIEGIQNLTISKIDITNQKVELTGNIPKNCEESMKVLLEDNLGNQEIKSDEEISTNDLLSPNKKENAKVEFSKIEETGTERKEEKHDELGVGHQKLYGWLNKNMKIEMTDGRILIGVFLCTDRDGNVILGSCSEYINPEVCGFSDEPRILGLVMVPGRHIVSIHHDTGTPQTLDQEQTDSYT